MIKTTTKKEKAKKGQYNHLKAVEGQVLNEEQIQAWIAHFNERGNFPGFKIPCSVTGKLSTCVGPWKDKKIKEFGSAEALLRNYKSRQALKELKPLTIKPIGSAKKSKKAKVKEEEQKNYNIPQFKETVRGPLQGQDLIDNTKNACQRPDVFLDNGRHCLECNFYKVCQNSLKNLPKGWDFDGEKFVDIRD